MKFLNRKILLCASLFTVLFILFTKTVPAFLIHRNVLYDRKGIMMKAWGLSDILTWPFSGLFPGSFVSSYYFLPLVFLYYLALMIAFVQLHQYLREKKLYRWLIPALVLPFVLLRLKPNLLTHLDNDKPSKSIGTPGEGKLVNGKRLAFEGTNFQYFNFLSYLKGNCFIHEKVKKTLLDTYKTCETTCPGIRFYTGEGSKKTGGTYVFNHRTHQNGTSIDLLTVFKKDGQQYDPVGLFNAYGYGIETDQNGRINKSIPVNLYAQNTSIDFETNAKFLLALDDACHKNGIKIKIVIFKTELKPLLFASVSGKKLLSRPIRFASSLPEMVNRAHDDHFHIDFIVP